MTSWDVVVVGARVAGAATAMLLAREGLRVLCVDRSRYGSDTLSTHALMRGGVLQLQRWGLLEPVAGFGHAAGAADGLPLRRRQGRCLDQAGRRGRGAVRPAPHRARRPAGRCRAAGRRQRGVLGSGRRVAAGPRRKDVRGGGAGSARPLHPGRARRPGGRGRRAGLGGRRRGAGPDRGERTARRRVLLRLLGRPADRRVRVVLLTGGDRRPDPDQRRSDLPVRRRGSGAAALRVRAV